MKGGTLIKKEDGWYIENEKLYPKSIKLHPDEDTENLKEGDVVGFEYVKTFLANETLWWAKLAIKKENWRDIIDKYHNEIFWDEDILIPFNFVLWLEDNYYTPNKK